MNEMSRLVEGGLDDISVSRAGLAWGVTWPGDDDHVVYVWIEALINYLSATGFPEPGFDELWPADMHVIGKDITRFHCVIWPAMLMSAELPLPAVVWAHGFVNIDGKKLSKSEGVRVELADAIERHGPDAFRYAILREVPWNGDGDISWERLDVRYTADLADNFGNLISRTLSMIERYRDGIVPAAEPTSLDRDIVAALVGYRAAMDANLLHQGASAAMDLASAANQFIEQRAPWSLAKDPAASAELDATLASLARTAVALATLLHPFSPGKIGELLPGLGLESLPALDDVAELPMAGRKVEKGAVLFPKPTSQPA
jgi:methionyl-tRNA synthetase